MTATPRATWGRATFAPGPEDVSAALAAWWKQRPRDIGPAYSAPAVSHLRRIARAAARRALAGTLSVEVAASWRWAWQDARRRHLEHRDARRAWEAEGARLRALAAGPPPAPPPELIERERVRARERARASRVRRREAREAERRAAVLFDWACAVRWVEGRTGGAKRGRPRVTREGAAAARREARRRERGF